MPEITPCSTGQNKLTERRCTNIQSATNYNFEGDDKKYFYYDQKEKTITKSKYGNPFYLDGDNYMFRPGEWRKVQLEGDEFNTISVLGLGTKISRATLKNHNVIAKIQYSKN
jgi:lipopolysaccharide export LptBFGC system permease protein LptF